MSRTAFIDTTRKETGGTDNTITHSQPEQTGCKMLASTMQISNNNPTNTLNHPTVTSSKGRNRKPNHTPHPAHTRGGERAADPSGPNSVPDPTPANAGPE
jgi:hypothetical protein